MAIMIYALVVQSAVPAPRISGHCVAGNPGAQAATTIEDCEAFGGFWRETPPMPVKRPQPGQERGAGGP